MRILGIDPGTVVCGFGIVQVVGHQYRAMDYGCIRPPRNEKLSERYLVIFNGIEELIHLHRPDALAVETQFGHKNIQSTIKLGMSCGAVIVAASKNKVPIFEYAPKKAKLAVVGTGKASKEQVQGMIKTLLRLPSVPTPSDAADALSLAICHAQAVQAKRALGQEV